MRPKIVSQIKIGEEWVNQEDISTEIVNKIVEDTIKRAAAGIGLQATLARKEKSA